ncbi:MAG: hypothetical protein ACRYG6_02875 [Janthinobacterium lividum]
MDISSVVGSTLRVLPPVVRTAPPTVPEPPVPKDSTVSGNAGAATDRHLLRITV